jgi:uncharacterized Rmd1/YagE family protein
MNHQQLYLSTSRNNNNGFDDNHDNRDNSTKIVNDGNIPSSHPTNNFTEQQEKIEMTKDKLRDLLNILGISMNQWNIQENTDSVINDNTSSRRRRRHNTRRIPEEFDVYNHPHGSSTSRRSLYRKSLVKDKISARLRVRSVHAAQTIDIVSVLTNVFGSMSELPAISHMFGKTSVIVQLSPVIQSHDSSTTNSDIYNKDVDAFFHPMSQPRYVAIFRYGSIVFFNVRPKDAGHVLDQIKKYSSEPIARSFERKEHFEVAISPQMEQDAFVTSDFAMVKELNINNVAVLSTVMGQTVAFDSYSDVVDEMLATFDRINSTVKRTGNFTAMQKETLFKVVAQNNSLFIDMIAKLGIKDRSDTAWNNPQYEKIFEGMKNEFEIEDRFQGIEFKLNLIQQNAKFFLDILHNQKSDTMEWTIVVLIAFECVLMIMDMSGVGQSMFETLSLQPSSPKPEQ